jgi:hypothetical protein
MSAVHGVVSWACAASHLCVCVDICVCRWCVCVCVCVCVVRYRCRQRWPSRAVLHKKETEERASYGLWLPHPGREVKCVGESSKSFHTGCESIVSRSLAPKSFCDLTAVLCVPHQKRTARGTHIIMGDYDRRDDRGGDRGGDRRSTYGHAIYFRSFLLSCATDAMQMPPHLSARAFVFHAYVCGCCVALSSLLSCTSTSTPTPRHTTSRRRALTHS